jgi:hypothetical protein
VLCAHTHGLADARSCVVQQEQQCVVAQAGRGGTIGLRENLFYLLGLKILGHWDMRPFAWNRQHALILIGPRQIMLDEMLEEAADRGEPHVPASNCVGTLGL